MNVEIVVEVVGGVANGDRMAIPIELADVARIGREKGLLEPWHDAAELDGELRMGEVVCTPVGPAMAS